MKALTEWERNIVGPFKLVGRFKGEVDPELPGLVVGQGIGRVFRAYRRQNGRRSLVVVPPAPLSNDWAVRVQSSASGPTPFLAVEVEQAPQGEAPVTELAAGLRAASSVLEDLEQRSDAAEFLTLGPVGRRRPRGRGGRIAGGLVVGLCAAACTVAGVAWWPPATGPGPAREPAPEVVLAGLADDAAMYPDLKASTMPRHYRQHALAGDDLPKTGRPGQAKPDKNGKCERFEVAIYGYCWVKLDGQAPCGPTAYDYKGGCYRPVFETPTSRRGQPPGPGPLTSAE